LDPLKEDLLEEFSTGGGGNIEVEGVLAVVDGVIGCWLPTGRSSSLATSLVVVVTDSASLATVDSRRKCRWRD
jgi:hypothetical protein